MDFHPLSTLFPLLDGLPFDELKQDIFENGLREPVVVLQGQILDGRNRWRACQELGMEAICVEWADRHEDDTPLKFVLSMNLHRRHLGEGQRAMVAETLATAGHGGDRASKSQICELTRDDASKLLNVSPRSIDTARTIRNEGTPEIISQVEAGELSLNGALTQVRNTRVFFNSGNNEWYTPTEYITAAHKVMGGIDLDPASSRLANKAIKATTIYTANDDGLMRPWSGRVWLNPPYSGDLVVRFIEKLKEHCLEGDVSEAIVLVNNGTETGWFRTLIDLASAVVFPTGRICFIRPDGTRAGTPLQGQAFIYIGRKPQRFLKIFSPFGWGATHS